MPGEPFDISHVLSKPCNPASILQIVANAVVAIFEKHPPPGREDFSEEVDRTGNRLTAQMALSLENEQHFHRANALVVDDEGIREEERAKIALEIHDELGQSLTGLKLDLASLTRRLAKQDASDLRSDFMERIDEMSVAVDSTILTLRRIATQLRPPVLDRLGLVAAIEWQVHDFQKRTGIRSLMNLPETPVVLDPKRSIVVYRIVQEALTNVVRHAKASQIAIALQVFEDHLVLEFSDNGEGMKHQPSLRGCSLGLHGMKERVSSLGGLQTIATSEGGGTRITSWIPLQDNRHWPLHSSALPNKRVQGARHDQHFDCR